MAVKATAFWPLRNIAVLAIIGFTASPCYAAWWRFVPGDAYFRGVLTQEFVTRIQNGQETEPLIVRYNETPPHGSFGYEKLEINGFSKLRRELLSKTYFKIRKTQPQVCEIESKEAGEVRREINGMALLIYNRDFDYKEYAVGLRYNEAWMDEGSAFLPRWMVNYDWDGDRVPDYVIEDWRNSKPVAPLKATVPTFPGREPSDLQFTAMTINSKDVNLIVVKDGDLESARSGESRRGFYVVEEDRVISMWCEDGRWVTEIAIVADAAND